MAVQTTTDGRIVTYVSKRKKPLLGADIKGIQAYHLDSALTEKDEKVRQSPQHKKPVELIESMRIVGKDELTARDQAVYEMMLSSARDGGIEKEQHVLGVSDIMRYLEVDHVDRVIESSYCLTGDGKRSRGKFSLADYDVTEELRSGTAILTYSIPPAVRKMVLESTSYALLDINVFAKFRCRYAPRLYQRLAKRAGQHKKMRKPWVIDPQELADELGYPYKSWNFRHFQRDVLVPALKDIADCVGRFGVHMPKPARSNTRGGRVKQICFVISDRQKESKEIQASAILPGEKYLIQAPDAAHLPNELPSAAAVARAVTLSGHDPVELSKAYRLVLDKAKADPDANVSGSGLPIQGAMILWLAKDGADEAFLIWAKTLQPGSKLETWRGPGPDPKAAAAPIVVIDTPEYKRTTYPGQRVAPPPAPRVSTVASRRVPLPRAPARIIVDDPFDYVPDGKEPAKVNFGDVCPF
ncbi:MAG: replication initiation protein [Mesorhizobium sp.]|nr:replication initiation protein [Mesorhizobium sp.]